MKLFSKATLLHLLMISGLMFAITGCAELPVLNPHPKYFLTIKGYISPELKNKVHLKFIQDTATDADACLRTTNVLAGMKEGYAKTDTYSVSPDEKGQYKITIPIDKYKKGKCEWIPQFVSLYINSRGKIQQSGFASYGKEIRKIQTKSINYYCNNSFQSCSITVRPKGAHVDILLSSKNSRTIFFNIFSKEK